MKKNEILDYAKSNPLNGGASFTLKNRMVRGLWNVVWFLFASWTPPFMCRWRRLLLVIFGAKMGWPTDVRGRARIWYPPLLEMKDGALIAENVVCYNQAKVVVGNFALVSQGAYLCAGGHNVDDINFQLIARPICIGARAWVAAEAFIGPGVTVHDGAVLGARACAFSDLSENTIYVGNPAKPIRLRKF